MTKLQTKKKNSINPIELYQQRMKIFEKMAKREGYQINTLSIPMISFSKMDGDSVITISIDVDRYIMISTLEHPKKGVTKLKRENLTMSVVNKLIKNPRMHTFNSIKTTYL